MVKKLKKKEELVFILLALPSLLGIFLFFIIPYGMSVQFSFTDNNVTKNFVGLANYIEILGNDAFQMALKNTTMFMLICVPVNMIIPLMMAMLLHHAKKHKNIFGVIYLLPLVIPSGSVVQFWKSIFSMNGIINGHLFFGHTINWLDESWSIIIVVVIFMWKNAGYNTILYLAGLNMIPKDYYECFSLEGGGKIRAFFSVTLPYLAPTTFLVFVMSISNSFKAFKEVYLLSGAYPEFSLYMLQHYINNQFKNLNYQKLSATSIVISAFMFILIAALLKLNNRKTAD